MLSLITTRECEYRVDQLPAFSILTSTKTTRKTQRVLVRELMFADDTAFVAHFHQDAQDIITLFAQAAKILWIENQHQENRSSLSTISRIS